MQRCGSQLLIACSDVVRACAATSAGASVYDHVGSINACAQVLFWDLRTSRQAGKFEESHTEAVTCCAFHPAQRGALLTARRAGRHPTHAFCVPGHATPTQWAFGRSGKPFPPRRMTFTFSAGGG